MTERRWSGWGASEIGLDHRRAGVPNQDSWMIRHFRAGITVAVSDGLGSCRHADVGSRAACRAVAEAAGHYFRNPPAALNKMPALVQHLWEMMLSGHPPADCSATCLFVAARNDAGAVLAQLGDGLIAACQSDGTVDLLMPDKSDSFANLTVGLASEQATSRWRTISVPEERYRAFVLCTDGISEDLEPEAMKGFAWEVYSHYERYSRRARGREVRRWLRSWPVPGHSDDKTIACIYRREGPHE